MSYSEIIKYELDRHSKNELIFASKLYKEKLYSKNVSETSFYKLLERMYKNKEIEKISKGVYYFPKKSKFGIVPVTEEEILSLFLKNNKVESDISSVVIPNVASTFLISCNSVLYVVVSLFST